MKKARFTPEQIVAILQEHATGADVGELTRRHGIAKATLSHWKKRSGDLEVSEAKKRKALDDENRRRKRLVADQALDLQILKDVLGQKR
jgi:putative transposase